MLKSQGAVNYVSSEYSSARTARPVLRSRSSGTPLVGAPVVARLVVPSAASPRVHPWNAALTRPRVRVVAPRFDYPRGHVETVAEYQLRGGSITTAPRGWSEHLLEHDTLLHILSGAGTDAALSETIASDLPVEVRQSYAAARSVDREGVDVMEVPSDGRNW